MHLRGICGVAAALSNLPVIIRPELRRPSRGQQRERLGGRDRGLGGIAGVVQLQLLQPFFGLVLAALVLHEPVAWTMIASTAVVILCVAGARRFA